MLNMMLISLLALSPNSSSFEESYILTMPESLKLSDSGSFEIGLTQNNLSDKQTLNVSIDDIYTLSDSHGKPDIYGNITNNEITFTSSDVDNKTIYYEVNNASTGNWSGNLNINVELISQSLSNTFKTGSTIQSMLYSIKPTKVSFSHDIIDGTYTYDLSLEDDESILLYVNGTEVTITNMQDEKFIANPSMANLFKNLSKLTTIENLDYIDMSYCNDMNNMFYCCSKLTNIDVSSWDTSNVTNMANLFASCYKLESIGDISNWDVSNVSSFEKTFYYDYKLSNYGDLGKWQVSSNCTNLAYMFASSSYTSGSANSSIFPASLDLSGWDVSNVTNMSNMFKNTFNLTSLNISNWNCNNVTNMSNMFYMQDNANTSKLSEIIGIDNLNIASANKTNMFTNCSNLSLPSWYQ